MSPVKMKVQRVQDTFRSLLIEQMRPEMNEATMKLICKGDKRDERSVNMVGLCTKNKITKLKSVLCAC